MNAASGLGNSIWIGCTSERTASISDDNNNGNWWSFNCSHHSRNHLPQFSTIGVCINRWILAAATRESWIRRTKSWLLRTKTTVWTPSTKCWFWRKPLNNCEKLKSFPDVTWILNSVLVKPLHLVAIIGHPYNGEPWETSVFHRLFSQSDFPCLYFPFLASSVAW